MDTFKVTSYNKDTGIAVVTFVVGGKTYTGVKVAGVPKGSVEQTPKENVDAVKSYMRSYVDAYIAGKAQEAAAKADIPLEVKALLNVATEF